MQRIELYLKYRSMSRAEFEALFPHPFLLVDADHLSSDKERFFVPTQAVKMTDTNEALNLLEDLRAEGLRLDDDARRLRLVPITKRERNPFKDRISLGRTTLADIVVEHSQVSKRHAEILFDSRLGNYSLVDCGSRNGTLINGVAVPERDRATLRYGDTISFGTFNAQFLSAHQVWELLRSVVIKA